jgi:hypothetical protein
MKKLRAHIFLFVLMSVVLSACISSRQSSKTILDNQTLKEFDVVFDGVPKQVEFIGVGSFADAVERAGEGLDALESIVAFRVTEVHKAPDKDTGKSVTGKSLPTFSFNKLFQSVGKGKVKDVFRRNSLQSNKTIGDRWFRIGVADPYETFGIEPVSEILPTKFRIYLKQVEGQEDTYIMLRHERI